MLMLEKIVHSNGVEGGKRLFFSSEISNKNYENVCIERQSPIGCKTHVTSIERTERLKQFFTISESIVFDMNFFNDCLHNK